MRAAVIESAAGRIGERFMVWFLTFSTAVVATQTLILSGALDVSEARQLSATGSLSGALIGGTMFGAGMILARGCSSRILILSATGNLRALVTGLVLTVVAQASLRGILSPTRQQLAELWTVPGGSARDLLAFAGGGSQIGMLIAITGFLLAVALAARRGIPRRGWAGGVAIGVVAALAWTFTYALSQLTFEPTPVMGISFVGPSADTLMGLINTPALPLTFDLGLIPGVFTGSLIACIVAGEFSLQGFEGGANMIRYLSGGVLMGFGGMLAGGCTVGAALTGSSVFSLTAWVAMASMWVAGAAMHRALDRRGPLPEPAPNRLSEPAGIVMSPGTGRSLSETR
ncbi:MAG: YeeE/YedE family protein [Hyphomicrobiales bacterium]|nr:YeeE/YedE family protein [Hyphomicrobiales bacterium]